MNDSQRTVMPSMTTQHNQPLKWIDRCTEKLRRDFVSSAESLKQFPPDLYIIFILKFFESYCYFAISQILVIYLHDEFGASDLESGTIYGMWGAAITLWGLLVSWINDNLGVKKSLVCGFSITFVSTIIIACTTSKVLLYLVIFAFYPIGTSMGIPMLTVAVKRYTLQSNRGFAFGLYYSVMNMAALVSGPVVDAFNIGLKDGVTVDGVNWSGNRMVILTTSLAAMASLSTTYLCLREIKVTELSVPSQVLPVHQSDSTDAEATSTGVEEYVPEPKSPLATAKLLCSSPTFWRFAVLTLFLVNLHAIFRHLDATLPTYLVRMFGDDVPKGTIYSINPFMIIFLTPLVAMLTNHYNHFNMIKYGGYVSAASPFFLAFSTSIWAAICMNVVLSLGEAIWSPRLYDYVMTIAPEGRESSFSALASAPLFAAKIPVGLMSGYLLHTYVPEHGHKDPKTMWLIIGLMTMTSPVLITLFDRCIREPEPRAVTTSSLDGDVELASSQNNPLHNDAKNFCIEDEDVATTLDTPAEISNTGDACAQQCTIMSSRRRHKMFGKQRNKYTRAGTTDDCDPA